MTQTFDIIRPQTKVLPIIVSCPHVGTLIPDDISKTMKPGIAEKTIDTDWFVHELYGFAPALGITLIKANYSRFVIDLNRDPSGKSLYSDQRRQTNLIPLTTFAGEPIYRNGEVSPEEINRRRRDYFDPYHAAIDHELAQLKKSFQHVLFFDAHSIKRVVKSIRQDPFPDMIVGDNDGSTADKLLSTDALRELRSHNFNVTYNEPFKGGFLTRSRGRPSEGLHALQLEMSQDLYMNEGDNSRNKDKQVKIASILEKLFTRLNATLESLNE